MQSLAESSIAVTKPRLTLPQIERVLVRNRLWQRIGYAPHQKQARFHDALARGARFFIIPAGTRSGKTRMFASEALTELGLNPPPGATHRLLQISAPNSTLTEKIFRYLWQWVVIDKILGAEPVRAGTGPQARYLEMPWGSRVDARTSEDPTGLQGDGLVAALCDEDADCRRDVWRQYIRRALSDYRGWSGRIGVPRGLNYWYKDYEDWTARMRAGDPDYYTDIFTSYDNPYLPDGEVAMIEAQAQREGWHDLFRQEYLAEFTSLSGMVYPNFSIHRHVGEIEPIGNMPFVLGLDWGFRNPAVCLFCQIQGDTLRIFDEIYQSGYTDAEFLHAVQHRAAQYGWTIEMAYPDQSSPEAIKVFVDGGIGCWQGKAPNVMDGIRQVRALFNRDDKPGILIHPRCVNLIRELQSYAFSEKGVDEKPTKEYDHACDALRYVVYCALGVSFGVHWIGDGDGHRAVSDPLWD